MNRRLSFLLTTVALTLCVGLFVIDYEHRILHGRKLNTTDGDNSNANSIILISQGRSHSNKIVIRQQQSSPLSQSSNYLRGDTINNGDNDQDEQHVEQQPQTKFVDDQDIDPCNPNQELPKRGILILRHPLHSIPSYHNKLYKQITGEQRTYNTEAWIKWRDGSINAGDEPPLTTTVTTTTAATADENNNDDNNDDYVFNNFEQYQMNMMLNTQQNNQVMTNFEYELFTWQKRTKCWIERYTSKNNADNEDKKLFVTSYERLSSSQEEWINQREKMVKFIMAGTPGGRSSLGSHLMATQLLDTWGLGDYVNLVLYEKNMVYPYRKYHPYTPEQFDLVDKVISNMRHELSYGKHDNIIGSATIEMYTRMVNEYDNLGSISQKHKLVYVHIPKSGGSTVETSNLFDDVYHPISGHFHVKNMKERMRNSTATKSGRMDNPNNFVTATTIRNPCERFISAFYYLQNAAVGMSDRQWAEDNIGLDKTINEFVLENAIESEHVNNDNMIMDMKKLYLHFKPQHQFLFDDDEKFGIDVLTCQENFNEGLNRIYKSIGMTRKDAKETRGEHKRDNSKSKAVKSCAALDPQIRDIIEQTYAMDYCIFEYNNNQGECIGSKETTTREFMTERYVHCKNQIYGYGK